MLKENNNFFFDNFKKWINKLSLLRKQLILFIYFSKKISFKSSKERPKIIICFDGLFSHGGLVDRFKGIVSFYEVAKILDYDFYIYFKHPFILSRFLKPNKLNWEIEKNDLKYNIGSTKVMYLMNNFDSNPLELIQKFKAKTFFIYNNIDYLSSIHPENSMAENQAIWRDNFNELFAKSNDLNLEMNKLPKEERIVIHTRFTTLMGDFNDTTNIVLDDNAKLELIKKIIKKIDEVSISNPSKAIFVLSDSIFFLNYIKENTSYSVLEGSPKHVDIKNNNSIFESDMKNFSDFYFISQSDEIIQIRCDGMYNSGFSKYASVLGNKKFTLLQ